MKKTPITGKNIPTAKPGFTPHHERRAKAHPVPLTVAEGWAIYSRKLDHTFAHLAPALLAEAVFYAGAALGLVLTMRAIDQARDVDTAMRHLETIKTEIERYARSIEDDSPRDP